MILLCLFSFVLLLALGFSVYMIYNLSKTILGLEDQIEESLDMLDEIYERIAYIASTPVMSDEPLVRDLLNNMRGARHAILLIANKLFAFGQTDSRQETDDDVNNT